MEQRYIAAMDLGSSKISLAIAEVSGENVEVIYYSETPSEGIKNSILRNPMKASVPIRKAILEAEDQLKIRIRQVVLGLPRYSVVQELAEGKLERSNANEYISREEIEALKEIALQSYPLDDEKNEIIYGAVAQSFSTDDEIQLSENDVVGTLSSTVSGNFKIFIGRRSSVTNIDKVFNDLGVAIAKKYFVPDVTARAVLSEEEKENGVALVDFGAGVTSVTIYSKGIMRHYYAIPFGGSNVSRDIRIECSISAPLAENIKLAYGACLPAKLANLSEKTLQIRYKDAPIKEIPVKYISSVIDAREREIVDAILYSIQESNLKDELRSGIVITGGGANMANLCNLIKDMSGYYVRIGFPKHRFTADGIAGTSEPGAVSVIGMLLASRDDHLPGCLNAPASIPVWLPEETAPVEEEEPGYEEPAFEEEPVQEEPEPSYEPEEENPEPESRQSEPAEPEPRPVPKPQTKPRPQPKPKQPKQPKQPNGNSWGRMIWTKIRKAGNEVGDFINSSVDKFYTSVTEEVDN